MQIKENTYSNKYHLSEKNILRKINQSKLEIQDIKVGIASFTQEETGQDEYQVKLNQERSNYSKLLKDLAIVKARSNQVDNKEDAKRLLDKMRARNQNDSPKKLINNEFRYDVFSFYKNLNDEKGKFINEKKQIIDNII